VVKKVGKDKKWVMIDDPDMKFGDWDLLW